MYLTTSQIYNDQIEVSPSIYLDYSGIDRSRTLNCREWWAEEEKLGVQFRLASIWDSNIHRSRWIKLYRCTGERNRKNKDLETERALTYIRNLGMTCYKPAEKTCRR